jgi:Raf kinase inhibitor-like YbhB/YbcL family protein
MNTVSLAVWTSPITQREVDLIRRFSGLAFAGSIAAGFGLLAAPVARAAQFDITSSAVQDGGLLAQKNAGNNPQNKNCDGQNISPPLAWTDPPANTKSYAIIMFDPVGRGGMGVVHWVAYDIPASKTSLKEGEASSPSSEFKGGKNTPGLLTYFGPCPPRGDKPHPYVITLIATDVEPGGLKPDMTRDELGAALTGHTLGATSIVTRYGH